jgi:hypothetical protein
VKLASVQLRALVLALLTVGSTSVRAEAPTQSLGFAFDAGLATSRDDILVPRALSGPRLALGPRYAAALGPGVLFAEWHIAAAYELDRDGYEGVAFDHALDAEYLFSFAQGSALTQALGPALGWDTDIAGIVSWDDAHAYWIASRWLGASWRAAAPAWLGYRWRFFAELPLLALLSRPPGYRSNKQDAMTHLGFYFFDVHADPDVVWLAQLQQLRASVDLWYGRSAGLVPEGWAIGSELRVAHAVDPASAWAVRATLRFSMSWGW